PRVAAALDGSVAAALEVVQKGMRRAGRPVNGWQLPSPILADFGADYLTRTIITWIAFGANLPADAVYPTTFVDAEGKPLHGANPYVLHFAAGQTPPVRAFWSVTLYDPDSFFVANPLDRYAISSWMPLRRGDDGSIDIHVRHDSPGKDLES